MCLRRLRRPTALQIERLQSDSTRTHIRLWVKHSSVGARSHPQQLPELTRFLPTSSMGLMPPGHATGSSCGLPSVGTTPGADDAMTQGHPSTSSSTHSGGSYDASVVWFQLLRPHHSPGLLPLYLGSTTCHHLLRHSLCGCRRFAVFFLCW